MSHDQRLIFCIHPITEDLRFLGRLIRKLRKKCPQSVRYLKLGNNIESHESCLKLLSQSKDGLLLFLCHGYANSILGCNYRGPQLDPTERFEYGPFIDSKNISALSNKRIIAFCCYSNGVAEAAVKAGAKAAIGFESIRFDYRENFEKRITFKKIQTSIKFEIRLFLYESIACAIDKHLTYLELVNHMRLLLNKRHRQVLISKKKHKQEIAAILWEIKTGIKLFGDKQIVVFA